MKSNKETADRKLCRLASDICMWGVSEQEALEIVRNHTGKTANEIRLYAAEQEHWCLYRNWTEPCWYAEVDNIDDLLILDRLNYLVVVSKVTGKIITEGHMAHW